MSDWECEGAISSTHELKISFLSLFLHGCLKVTLWCTDQQGPSGSIYAFIQPDTSSLAKQALISASACSCPQAKLSQVNCCCHISKEERWDPTETAVKERHACSHLPIPPLPYCFFTLPNPLAKVNCPDYFLGFYPLLPCTREGCYCWSKEEKTQARPSASAEAGLPLSSTSSDWLTYTNLSPPFLSSTNTQYTAQLAATSLAAFLSNYGRLKH